MEIYVSLSQAKLKSSYQADMHIAHKKSLGHSALYKYTLLH